ncbi:hypothetical protein COJ04_00175 [Bacillus thuringiensis]|nr:hypothetical protein COJ04_00175 [Bacillus thuringiensis]
MFSTEKEIQGNIKKRQYAHLSILSAINLLVLEVKNKHIESALIVVSGKFVYGTDKIQKLSPSAPKSRTGRLPIITFGGMIINRKLSIN